MLTEPFLSDYVQLGCLGLKYKRATRLYLAVPYTVDHTKHSALWEDIHFRQVTLAAAVLISGGFFVFSPITHSHIISTMAAPQLAHSFDTWMPQDEQFLMWADAMVMLELEYAKGSRGVAFEIAWCVKHKTPIYNITMQNIYDLEDTNAE